MMTDNLKKLLPVLAMISACVWATSILVLGVVKETQPSDSPRNRSSAEQILATFDELRPVSPDDPGFRRALDEVLARPLIATVWLFTPDGRVLVSKLSLIHI